MKRAALALSLCLLAPLAASGQEEDSAVSASEEIELDAIAITGNDELPRILAIVPWKAAEPGEVPGARWIRCSTKSSRRSIAGSTGAS
jgi:hypothetical protein